MPLTAHNPPSVAAPIGPYSHGIEIPAGARLLHVAGQVGIKADGSVPKSCAEQCEVVWQNLVAILKSAGMDPSHITKMNTYLTNAADFPVAGPIRVKYLKDHKPASTGVCVTALARPEFLIEIEVYAAKG